ncbi:hypothetical protein LZ30DRAFT_740476 [Colletotrichum cereale]|nr:hypothetical protein LZ30DRAFT_740476 [Colletotrichum cereale]
MKASITQALILALVTSVKACALYNQCRCTMADGSVNNTITEIACQTKHDNIQGANDLGSTAFLPTIDAENVTWCNSGRSGKIFFYVENCGFRETCTASGATGADSWCQGKTE